MIRSIAAIVFPLKSYPRGVALFPLPPQPADGRGFASCPWSRCLASIGPAVGGEVRADLCNEVRRRSSGRLGDKWHLDEAVVSIRGKKHWFWRAVDQDGLVLEVLVQSRRNATAAKRLMHKLLKCPGRSPRGMVTDKLRSYEAAKREVIPGIEHRSHKD